MNLYVYWTAFLGPEYDEWVGCLSKFEVLSMVFTGFRFAFLHNDLKLPLIEKVGEEIYDNLRALAFESQ